MIMCMLGDHAINTSTSGFGKISDLLYTMVEVL